MRSENVISKSQFLEYLRLATVAASEAAEAENERIALDPNESFHNCPTGTAFIRLNGNGKIVRLLKTYGQDCSQGGDKFYFLDNISIAKWEGTTGYELKLGYSMCERKEKQILIKAYLAVQHVLSQIEKNISMVVL
jgi:hypothetical protein